MTKPSSGSVLSPSIKLSAVFHLHANHPGELSPGLLLFYSMKIATYIIRFLLSLLFIWHGIEKLFLQTPMKDQGFNEAFTHFYDLLSNSGFLLFVGVCQLLCGILLVFKRTSLLGAIMLVPLLLCLIMTHVFISHNTTYILFDSALLGLNTIVILSNLTLLKITFLSSQDTVF